MARGLGGPIVKAATRCLYRIEVLETTLNSQGEGGGTGIFVRLPSGRKAGYSALPLHRMMLRPQVGHRRESGSAETAVAKPEQLY